MDLSGPPFKRLARGGGTPVGPGREGTKGDASHRPCAFDLETKPESRPPNHGTRDASPCEMLQAENAMSQASQSDSGSGPGPRTRRVCEDLAASSKPKDARHRFFSSSEKKTRGRPKMSCQWTTESPILGDAKNKW